MLLPTPINSPFSVLVLLDTLSRLTPRLDGGWKESGSGKPRRVGGEHTQPSVTVGNASVVLCRCGSTWYVPRFLINSLHDVSTSQAFGKVTETPRVRLSFELVVTRTFPPRVQELSDRNLRMALPPR